ncbi:hypothetical protein [Prochlorothrix hollandica]|uniref:hypothetical protein n=1 Tax=Prochlorothrix hollandica TaxID=1223 RepID=UPI00034D0D0F|nr:hypothetical protein [Prochlorothrix hollandica]
MESYKNVNPRVTRPVVASQKSPQDKVRQGLIFASVTWIPLALAVVATSLA